LCRHHMKQYLTQHPILYKNWISQTSEEIRSHVRNWLNKFHNSVNSRLEKPVVELGDPASFDECIHIIDLTYLELMNVWSSHNLMEWKYNMNLLIRLLKCGPQ
jgi:hypothetical protein